MLKTKLMSALVLTVAGAAAQAAIPDALTFDGYCDGITGITSQGGGIYAGIHDYTVCGGYTNTSMSGPFGRRLMGSSVGGVAATDSSYTQFGASFSYVVNEDGTWYLIAPEYGGLVNSGTWSPGYGGADAKGSGLHPSFMK